MNLVFANPGWLGFSFLALAPLVIHLLYKRRVKVVKWPSVALLEEVRRENRRSLRLQEWMLLVLRTLLVLSVVLAVSGPVLAPKGSGLPSGKGGHRVVALVLDNSLSMGLSENGVTLLDEAVLRAEDILRSVHRPGDAVAVVPACGAEGRYEEVYSVEEAGRRLREVRLCGAGGDVLDALRTVESFASSEERLVYVFSDFQRSVWSNLRYGGGKGMRVVLVSLARRGRANVVVDEVRPPLVFAGAGPGGVLKAVLRNTGDAEASVSVTVHQDGRKTGETRVSLGGGGVTEVELPWNPGRPGLTTGFVAVEGDRLKADDRRWFAVRTPPRMRVAVVDDSGGAASVFLRKVFEAAGAGGFLEVLPTGSAGLAGVLGRSDVVVMAAFRGMPAGTAEALRRFLEEGGGLWVATEDRMDIDEFNRVFDPGIIPCRVLGRSVSSGTDTFLGAKEVDFSHPLLSYFEGTDLFRHGRFRGYYRAALREADPGLKVLVRMETGEPLLVEYGHRSRASERETGRVLLFLSSLSDSLNGFPYTRNFPVFVLQSLRFLVERSVPEFPAGTPGEAIAGRTGPVKGARMERWDGRMWVREEEDPVTTVGVWRFGEEVFLVRTPPEESEVAGMTEEELRRVFGNLPVIPGDGTAGRKAVEAETGRSLAPWAILLALLCAAGEAAVLFGFRRRMAAEV